MGAREHVLPAGASEADVVGVVDPGRSTGKVIALDAPPPLPVRALEEYLRWQEEEILWNRQTTSEDGPYTDHPRLGGLPREVREQVADSIGEGKVIRAIKVLRDGCPGMSLSAALTVIEALRL